MFIAFETSLVIFIYDNVESKSNSSARNESYFIIFRQNYMPSYHSVSLYGNKMQLIWIQFVQKQQG